VARPWPAGCKRQCTLRADPWENAQALLPGCTDRSDGSSADEETERVAASAEEELEQLQHLNLGGFDSRDGVLDEVSPQHHQGPAPHIPGLVGIPAAAAAGPQAHIRAWSDRAVSPGR
jgi:hypothetical protein